MTVQVARNPIAVTGLSGAGALLLLFGLLFLLSFVQKEEAANREIENLDIRSVEIPSPDDESDQLATVASSQVSTVKQLPTQPRRIPTLTVEPMPLELQVDVAQVLEQRDTLNYLMSQRDLYGAFGSVRLQGTDSIPRSLYIPPNHFPQELRERGIDSGDVLLILEISEEGVATVRQVVEADYPEIVAPVIESIEGAIYSRPLRHGKPTRTIIKSLVHFSSGPEGESIRMNQTGGRRR